MVGGRRRGLGGTKGLKGDARAALHDGAPLWTPTGHRYGLPDADVRRRSEGGGDGVRGSPSQPRQVVTSRRQHNTGPAALGFPAWHLLLAALLLLRQRCSSSVHRRPARPASSPPTARPLQRANAAAAGRCGAAAAASVASHARGEAAPAGGHPRGGGRVRRAHGVPHPPARHQGVRPADPRVRPRRCAAAGRARGGAGQRTARRFVVGRTWLAGEVPPRPTCTAVALTRPPLLARFDPWFNFRATQYLHDNGLRACSRSPGRRALPAPPRPPARRPACRP